ncbi:hypothetical protein TPA0910_87130 [Streptomyces hygroscopicus subsp. sporocinereus]|uniref:DeoxyPurine in DNA protein A domain-containing protein n=1 Tax=Streptomyces hygroscopicus TaxID=1912 RepID=A0ABQ3UFA1_STRHY|nr:hypothetical protein [Streptomyces hygroscopicus]GHJ34280.1 hypothetical protein TPA0910_87130 [Streptomyces hygroscopicus]
MRARFLLGIPEPSWLWQPHPGLQDVALFPSRTRLSRRKTTFPKALHDFAIDSGGFTELKKFGGWRISPQEYADEIRRYRDELGPERMLWAAPQDNMCEPWVIYGKNQHLDPRHENYFHGTRELRGLGPDDPEQDLDTAVRIHVELTVENFLEFTRIAPDLNIIPVIQGWLLPHYFYCKKLYEDAGIDLMSYPVVGLGSVCRREDTQEIAEIVDALSATGLRLHGFGVKTEGLGLYGDQLVSADSQAWSYGYRKRNIKLSQCTHPAKNCSYCLEGALDWYRRIKDTPPDWRQMTFDMTPAA